MSEIQRNESKRSREARNKSVRIKAKIPFGYVLVLSTLVVILLATLGYSYFAGRATAGFKRMQYENMPEYYEQTKFRDFLEDLGVELYIAGTEGKSLTFSSPMKFRAKGRFGVEYDVKLGDTLVCDFISWSGDGTGNRHIKLSINGQTYDVNISPQKVARLYVAALKENGLEDQFYQDTGEELSIRSARAALRFIDQQIFEKQIYAPWDYPFDRDLWQRIAGLVAGSWPFALAFIYMVFEYISDYAKYVAWLEEYNQNNQERWDKISGNLPQFVSLEESGERGKPKFKYHRSSVEELVKRLFAVDKKIK